MQQSNFANSFIPHLPVLIWFSYVAIMFKAELQPCLQYTVAQVTLLYRYWLRLGSHWGTGRSGFASLCASVPWFSQTASSPDNGNRAADTQKKRVLHERSATVDHPTNIGSCSQAAAGRPGPRKQPPTYELGLEGL